MMGGRIGSESREGEGATFWFTAAFEKQSPQPASAGDDIHADLRNAKVLVVDDNATNRNLVCRLLSAWGCRPEEAAGGNSALLMLRQATRMTEPFRVALVDTSLPDVDGEELGRQMAADSQLNGTALVLMGSLGRQIDPERLQASGFAGHVSKPIWERSLREAMLALGGKGNVAARPVESRRTLLSALRKNGHARILVAEDNWANQTVAEAMLNKLGYHADLVANGLEALQALRKADYDVVLMDCEMPEMDGYEASRRVRDLATGARNHSIPIIAVTADAMPGDREKCLQAGMSDYLAKPIEAPQLAAILEKWLALTMPCDGSPPIDQ